MLKSIFIYGNHLFVGALPFINLRQIQTFLSNYKCISPLTPNSLQNLRKQT